jgi:thiol-disulfide isomerase/thioredoxin
MKRSFFILALVFSGITLFAQNPEIIVESDGTKVLKGFVSRQLLTSDPSFAWFAENQKSYTPNAVALEALKNNKEVLRFLVFGGTWCGDTKFVLPKFYSLADAAGVGQERITLLGVDRSKKTIQNLSEAFNVTNVPTIIVLKDGKEIGRVVEYGTSGVFDKDLGEIISRIK